MEQIPLPDNSIDVIISNCVINLSADKNLVLWEAFRVLKPGGRFAVSDVVTRGGVPPEVRRSMLLWVGCIAGALEEYEYVGRLAKAGFDSDRCGASIPHLQRRRRAAVSDRRRHRRGYDRAAGGRKVHERLYPRGEARKGVLWPGVL